MTSAGAGLAIAATVLAGTVLAGTGLAAQAAVGTTPGAPTPALSGSYGSSDPVRTDGSHHQATAPSAQTIALYGAMRELWADHMQWTRATVDAYFHDQDAVGPTLDRLLQNQKDLGAAIVPFYGQGAGDQLAALLTEHIQQAVPVLEAARVGDQAALDKGLADWYANAKQIADFLSAANPERWPTSATEPMMKEHIDTTVTYSVDLLKGDYAQSIKDYDIAFDHMMMLADTLSQGIIAQFPDKFAGGGA